MDMKRKWKITFFRHAFVQITKTESIKGQGNYEDLLFKARLSHFKNPTIIGAQNNSFYYLMSHFITKNPSRILVSFGQKVYL